MELTNSLFREENLWNADLGMGPDLQDILSPEQAYSTHSDRPYQPQGYDQIPIDMEGLEGIDFDPVEQVPTPPVDNNQVAAWYDTDL